MASDEVTEPITPCAACEVGVAVFLLPSGAPVCPECYLALASPETMRLIEKTEPM
jgi:hypothetical protein